MLKPRPHRALTGPEARSTLPLAGRLSVTQSHLLGPAQAAGAIPRASRPARSLATGRCPSRGWPRPLWGADPRSPGRTSLACGAATRQDAPEHGSVRGEICLATGEAGLRSGQFQCETERLYRAVAPSAARRLLPPGVSVPARARAPLPPERASRRPRSQSVVRPSSCRRRRSRHRGRHLRELPPWDPSGPDPTSPPETAWGPAAACGGAKQLR